MKPGMKGFLLGLSASALLTLGVAFGIDEDINRVPDALINEVNKLVAATCQVSVGQGRLNTTDRCFNRNEVMTGRQGNSYIYCSQVTVDCFHKARKIED